jgi:hypothetical protein
MKKTLTPIHRSGGRSRTGRWFKQTLATAALLVVAAGAHAQISINLGVNPTIDFTVSPLNVLEWATQDNIQPGDAATYGSPAALDDAAQLIDQASIVTVLPTVAGIGTARVARQNTTAGNIFTQPTGVPAAVIKATLQNNSGGDLNVLRISYAYTIPSAPVTDNVPGQRVFWSLSGTPSSWALIPELSGVTAPGTLNATVGVGTWATGTPLYLMWLDDNNQTGNDGAFAIDNVVFTTEVSSPIVITNDPDSLVVGERGTAVFTVEASGSPQGFHWLSNGVPIPGANSATYTIPSAPYSANGAVYSCIVSNGFNSPTSAGATLTVTVDATPPTVVRADASTNNVDVVITFSEPILATPLPPDPSSFTVFPTGTDPDVTGIVGFSLVVDGSTITVTLSGTLTDGVNYSVRMFDLYDTSEGVPGGNVIDPNPSIIAVRRNLLLIDFDGPNNVWKYSIETNLFGTGWETASYDDSDIVAWPEGPAALGVNTDANANSVPIRTATAYTPNSAPQFFRRHFFVPASSIGTTLSIRHLFEDGAVVFINGQEAGRFNVGTGVLSVATRALANFAENSPLPAPVPLSTAGLVAGDNVIAVAVFQNGGTSSDSIMALELVANIGTYAAGPPSIVTQPVSQSVNEGANVNFSVVADGALPLTYQWSRNGAPLDDATNSSYSIIGVLPSQAGDYRVLVTNGQGTSNSAIATLTVAADTTAPAFVSAVGAVNLTNITLTITDAFGLNQTAAETEANYNVALTAGGGNLTIESAVLINPTTVLLTTSPRTPLQNYTVTLSGIVDRSEAANVATPSSRPIQATVILFGYNQVWKYDESGNDLGSTWKDVGYNDGAWPSGAGFLGFEANGSAAMILFTNLAGGSGTNTSLNLTNQTLGGIGGTNITFYFRTSIGSLPFDPSAPGNVIRATSYFDDGGVIYVNGSEQVRFNLTNSPVALNYTNYAIAGSTEGAGGLVTSNLQGFVQANNIIAAEVHQNTFTSSDIAWGMQLEALVTTFGAGCPKLFIVDNGGTVTITWTGTATLQSSPDISSPLNWSNVSGSPTSPYITPSVGAPKFFRLVCP